jgi:prepilin signal peptidase PulO-like enzyme (type II secretory pathway)
MYHILEGLYWLCLYGRDRCCLVIKFYTYPVNINKFYLFINKEGYVFFKNEFITIFGYTFVFLKIPLLVMYMPIFKFQNMVDMHKRYAYQNFNSIA